MIRVLLFFALPLAAQDAFIKNIFEVKVPNFKGAYNGSILEDGEGYLLAFRYDTYLNPIQQHKEDFKQHIGLVKLNNAFKPIGKAELCLGDRAYDPRLFRLREDIYLIFASPHPEEKTSLESSHLNLALLNGASVERLVPLHIPFQNHWEKNWVLFDYNDNLHLEYTIDPQVVASVDPETGLCAPLSELKQPIQWPYGIIRGGTPALEVDGEYLAFFHSSVKKRRGYTYYIGAYTFSKEPPFQITRISPKPFQSSQFYSTPACPLSISRVLFPGGFVVRGDTIYLCYGENDAAIKVMAIDKKALLESLTITDF